MADRVVDVLIVGGGLTGAALSLALKESGMSSLLIEARPISPDVKPNFDGRSLALSPASICILKMIGVWDKLAPFATPIQTIHISEQKKFGVAQLKGKPNESLGAVVEMEPIQHVLYQLVSQDDVMAPAKLVALDADIGIVTVEQESGVQLTVKAKLIVAADGTHSEVRRLCGIKPKLKDYGQSALVANIALARTHQNTAYERFTPTGPLALLPMSENRMALVWSLPPEIAKERVDLDEAAFIEKLHETIGYRVGRITHVGRRALYPLKQVLMKQQVAWPIIFVGNAAHTLHPVAGQGFNLGLRDVAFLAECVMKKGLTASMAKYYEKHRQYDQETTIQLTNGLIELFTSILPGASLARSLGLVAFDTCQPAKKILARYASGFGGFLPELVCGIPLK